ncbi:DUF3093 domain-containing protein [Mycolicibacterium confluentis]|uniref:Uncharacterized protein n=1 Tax=Mycolicibacterium confluentis TaxID=28047 RepID=A0A7I7Y172_9MYCO|nr:DUF3093 domain-containing protein [Mycolicibacterium confluentis]ORV21904.1 hypothetical protein AWB99_06065 [Mycolicibacterium confluentis]BBZ35410.1 hypothetical protein MCNF_40150 [Mycolicibacterium confluentis]
MDDQPLFSEPGASWYWVLAGPASAVAMMMVQLSSGNGVQWVVPIAFLVLVSGFVALQVKAARIHTSVELTRTHLRQGTQTVNVDEIVKVYPAPKVTGRRHYDGRIVAKNNALTNRALRQAGIDAADLAEKAEPEPQEPDTDRATVEKWQASRALGELTGVPRGRTGIGLRLTGGRTAQAWARNHKGLRMALTPLVEERAEPSGKP